MPKAICVSFSNKLLLLGLGVRQKYAPRFIERRATYSYQVIGIIQNFEDHAVLVKFLDSDHYPALGIVNNGIDDSDRYRAGLGHHDGYVFRMEVGGPSTCERAGQKYF